MFTKTPFDDFVNTILPRLAEANGELAALSYDFIKRQISSGARNGKRRYKLDDEFDVYNPEISKWLADYTALMADRVNKTIQQGLRKALIDGLESGATLREMTQNVLDVFGATMEINGKIVPAEKMKYRAGMIASTESTRAEHAGEMKLLSDAGAVRKTWIVSADACEFCQAIDSMTVETDKNFFNQGDNIELNVDDKRQVLKLDYSDTPTPPLHPWCRCSVIYEWE